MISSCYNNSALFLLLEPILGNGTWGNDMCSSAGGTHGESEVGAVRILILQSIDELFWGLWKPELRNELTKGNDVFLLMDCFDFMINSLVILKDNEENTKHYYFL